MAKMYNVSRRDALKTITILGSGLLTAPEITAMSSKMHDKTPEKDLGILAIGVNRRGLAIALSACRYGKMIACCDVDTATFGLFQKRLREYQDEDAVYYTDYRAALERKDVDIVTIGTPDHWHARMIIDAIEAGKDVYVEKPMTLTIDEGIKVCEAVKKSGRIVQVGTQQRSEYEGVFLKAVACAQMGLLGKTLKATVYLPSNYWKELAEFPITDPPDSINWDKWCGPIQKMPYCPERAHRSWRSWLETGYGPLTDWGAHHIDIANWALGVADTGPTEITAEGTFPLGNELSYQILVGEKSSFDIPNHFSTVYNYKAKLNFENGNAIIINGQDEPPEISKVPNGLLIDGEKGNIWIGRRGNFQQFEGSIPDKIEKDKKLQQKVDDKVIELYNNRKPIWMDAELLWDILPTAHMKNFIDCVYDRSKPISDVFTHHRSNSAVILAHASMLLKRKLSWNPEKQKFVNDEEANRLLSRVQREPYKV
ncbi:MAG: Gfo/Idh/MocA family oxidoreductase [Bacteroidales bacterium]